MQIALNKDYGGFSLTDKAYERLIELGMKVVNEDDDDRGADIKKFDDGHYMFVDDDNQKYRTDPRLITVIEELGFEASNHGTVKIVETEDIDNDYYIDWYDGIETLKDRDGKPIYESMKKVKYKPDFIITNEESHSTNVMEKMFL